MNKFYRLALLVGVFLSPTLLISGTLPDGFAELRLAQGLDGTTVNYAPDGRLFVTQKKGVINIIKNGAMLATPFLDLQGAVDNRNERGLQGMVFDPDFASNGYIYIYYTVDGASRNRVSRFTANGDVVVEGSEVVLVDLDVLSASIHNGGALFFKGGKLFITTGDGGTGNNASSFSSLLGKVLRINRDGTIPSDNPYYGSLSGNLRLIYALGFRNPFRAAVQPGTERVFINDVGGALFEEINELVAGKNYGWPSIEGKRTSQTPPANYQDPLFAYDHSQGQCSIGGGAFYNPTTTSFPAKYVGKYFFGDYCGNYIKVLDPATGTVIETFATNVNRPISFSVGDDGAFYYLARGGLAGGSNEANSQSCCSEVWRIRFTNNGAPTISAQPSNQLVPIAGTAVFAVGASGNAPLTIQWQKNGVNIPGATNYLYEYTNAQLVDNGAVFRAVVTNPLGSVTSQGAVLSVTSNLPPQPSIDLPTEGTLYSAGTVLNFTGSATDAEDGTLSASAFSWEINFHHDTHTHPAMAPTSGITSGTYTLSPNHDPATNVWYRIYLTVTDSEGQSATVYRDIHPIVTNTTLGANRAGLNLRIDGVQVATPYIFEGVAGIERVIEAPSPQTVDGISYEFVRWSDGGAATHAIQTPSTNQTITAYYLPLYAEAEWAAVSGATIRAAYMGFKGTGYADYDLNTGAWVEWTVDVPTAGDYRLDFRYANGSGTRSLKLSVNGQDRVASLAFPTTSGWVNWSVIQNVQSLQAGINKIRMTTIGSNGPNIDYLLITRASSAPTVSTPTFNPVPGTYTSTQNVSIATTTAGATIHYTVDGTNPTTTSPVYSTPIAIASTSTLKAIAVKSGMSNSAIQSGLYTINTAAVETPQFSPAPGTYASTQLVTITTGTAGSTIHYTLDGTTPTNTSPVYSSPVSISSTTTLKAMAVKTGMSNSSVRTGTYTIQPSGPFSAIFEAEVATLSGMRTGVLYTGFTGTGYADYEAATGAYIHWVINVPSAGQYRLDFRYANRSGTPRPLDITVNGVLAEDDKPFPPTPSWTDWAIVSSTVTLNAGSNTVRATSTGLGGGNIDHMAVTALNVGPVVSAPTFSPTPGAYVEHVDVTIASATSGAVIRYTTNGSTPTASSTVYSTPIHLHETTTIKAIAIKDGTSSSVTQAVYSIQTGDFDQIFEAEAATRVGVTIKANYLGFTGTGFGDFVNSTGDYLQWSFNVPQAGSYSLLVRYALPTGNRPLGRIVNGIAGTDIPFVASGAWENWTTVTVPVSLNAGTNTIRLSSVGFNGPNVDHIQVTNALSSMSVARIAEPEYVRGDGEEIIDGDDLEIFPIPARNSVTLRSRTANVDLIDVISADGKSVKPETDRISDKELTMHVRDLTNGLVVVQLRVGSQLVRRKILVRKD